jgi:hypothetical protein
MPWLKLGIQTADHFDGNDHVNWDREKYGIQQFRTVIKDASSFSY